MNPERFEQLAEAHGGEIRRWPEGERAGAQALLARRPELQGRLREAADLDGLLDAYATPRASAALAQRISGAAPRRRPVHRRLALWWAGAGLATAGALAGAMIVTVAPPPASSGGDGWIYDQPTAFGALVSSQDG
jgi:ferric-dicitrate binding protein FerR (iron transport regulator)